MRPLLIGLLAVILLAACGSSGESKAPPKRSASDLATVQARAGITQPTPTTQSAPSATARASASPTRRAQATVTATATATPAAANDPILAQALLTKDDLPTTWTTGGDYPEIGARLCNAPSLQETFEPEAQAQANYSSSYGDHIFEWIVRLDDDDASAAMQHARDHFSCAEDATQTESGTVMNWTFEDIDLSGLADDTYARWFQITPLSSIYTPMQGMAIFVREGQLVAMVLHVGYYVDPYISALVAEAAVLKLQGVPSAIGMAR